MSKRFKLLKDLPGIPAGTIGETHDDRVYFKSKPVNGFFWQRDYGMLEMKSLPDFFHDMDTHEPEAKRIPEIEDTPRATPPAAILTTTELIAIMTMPYPHPVLYAKAVEMLHGRMGLPYSIDLNEQEKGRIGKMINKKML